MEREFVPCSNYHNRDGKYADILKLTGRTGNKRRNYYEILLGYH